MAMDESEFKTLENIVVRVRKTRKPRSDRKPKTVLDLSGYTLRLATLLAISSGARAGSLSYTADQAAVEPLSPYLKYLQISESIGNLPSSKERSALFEWLGRIRNLRIEGYNVPARYIDEIEDLRLSVGTAEELVAQSALYPYEALAPAVEVLQANYRADALISIAAKERWSFE